MNPLDDVLARVDAEIAAWDASPHSWSPGDPLHPRPECTDDCDDLLDACNVECVALPACGHECEHQHVRPLFEIFEATPRCAGVAASTSSPTWARG